MLVQSKETVGPRESSRTADSGRKEELTFSFCKKGI